MGRIDPKALAAGIAIAIVTVGLVGLALHYGSAEQRDALVGAIVAVGVLAAGALRSWLSARQGPSALPLGSPGDGRDSLADELDEDPDATPVGGIRRPTAIRPPPRRGGWSGLDVAIVIICGAGLATVLAAVLSGCGASALRQHVSAARVLTIAHASIASTVETVVDAQAAECEARPEAERASCAASLAEVAGPVATGVDALRAGIVGYREASIAAAEIDSGEAALPALTRMLAGLLESALPAVIAAIERWGVDVPVEVQTYAAAAAAILRAIGGGAL